MKFIIIMRLSFIYIYKYTFIDNYIQLYTYISDNSITID